MDKKKALDSMGMTDIHFEAFKGVLSALSGLNVSEACGVLYIAKKAIHLESKINYDIKEDKILSLIHSGQLR